jgi:hypothetical protein
MELVSPPRAVNLTKDFKNPLSRGRAEERVVAGVCFCYKFIKVETHPSTSRINFGTGSLKRGIAQSRAFSSLG